MNGISRHSKRDLWLPDYEPRAFHPDWFDRLYRILPLNTRLLLQHSGKRRTLIQAGSHLGIWPEYFSHHFQKVITFEPNHILFHCTVKNTLHRKNIACINAALGDSNNPISLYVKGGKTGTDTCIPDGSEAAYSVDQVRLDDLNYKGVDAIQLDVEKYELFVLEGAKKTITSYKPAIQIEMFPSVRQEIETWLSSAGYEKIGAASKDEIWFHKTKLKG